MFPKDKKGFDIDDQLIIGLEFCHHITAASTSTCVMITNERTTGVAASLVSPFFLFN
jgi:hypothetical protein